MTDALGSIEILGQLSSGGMGDVLLGRRRGAHGFEKLVAVKTIRASLEGHADARKLFLDEARLVARIEHPCIAHVSDFGEENGTLFIAMEYVAGLPIAALLDRFHRLPPVIAMRIARETCAGLHAAHELTDLDGRPMNVVHRDVSPQNIMLTFDGRVKIIDFGIALARDRSAPNTEVGRLRGKLGYMAPEQATGDAIDRRTDVWAITAVLYEMLSGLRVRSATNLAGMLGSLDQMPTPVGTVVEGLPPGTDELVAEGLTPEREARLSDARTMAFRLDRLITAAGGPSLEEFALAQLADERAAHQQHLNEVLGGGSAVSTPTRGPTMVGTGALEASTMNTAAALTPGIEPATGGGVLKYVLAALLGFLLAGGATWWVLSTDAPVVDDRAPAKAVAAEPEPEPVVDDTSVAEPDEPIFEDESKPAVKKRRRKRRSRRAKRAETAPPPTPPAEAKPAGVGHVTIGADPYAVVIIDGVDRGVTPVVRLALPAGVHEIRFLHPDSRAVRATKRIRVVADRHRHVTID